jgi:hypothetical protein
MVMYPKSPCQCVQKYSGEGGSPIHSKKNCLGLLVARGECVNECVN